MLGRGVEAEQIGAALLKALEPVDGIEVALSNLGHQRLGGDVQALELHRALLAGQLLRVLDELIQHVGDVSGDRAE